jgi:Kef-type K+ transport system membrane component KefB
MDLSIAFLTLGGLFLAGLAADGLGRRTRLPRVTILLVLGVLAGRSGLGLIQPEFEALFGFLSVAALTLVAFLLGNALRFDAVAAHGRAILWVSVLIVLATLLTVTVGLWAIGVPLGLGLILAAIACATDPAATQDVLTESRASGGFSETIRGVVAVDDAWGLIVFSIVLACVLAMDGNSAGGPLVAALRDLGLATAIGIAIGLPGAMLSGRLKAGEPMQAEALGLVFLTAGLCVWLEVSYLLAGIVAGAVIANAAKHHERAFHEIEHFQWPFMLLFFLMAGASLELNEVLALGGIGVAYIALRIVGRLVGGWLGATVAQAPGPERVWIGPALLPQAGVAVGMALVAAETFPEWRGIIMSLTVGTTVVFELLGPPFTRLAVARVGPNT